MSSLIQVSQLRDYVVLKPLLLSTYPANERPQLAIRDTGSGSPEESLLVYLIRSSRPAAAFADFSDQEVSCQSLRRVTRKYPICGSVFRSTDRNGAIAAFCSSRINSEILSLGTTRASSAPTFHSRT